MKMKPDLSKIGAVTTGKTRTTGISPFSELEITKVYPNPDQPRKQFNDIEQLAATILEHGLLQPITVVKKDDRYMIIAGERRYKAHLHNEAKTIKAYIVDVSEEQVEELTLIENIQRNDLTDFEIAKHICKLWDSGRYAKKSDLAIKIGKSDSYISKSFNCLKLDSEIIDHIEQNKTPISIGVMDEIARVKDKGTQKEVFEKYNNGEITRDEIKEFKPKKLKLLNEIKTIEHIEIFGTDEIYIRYEDDTDKLLGYKEAKEIIEKAKQEKILFELCSNNEECYEFLYNLSNRVEKDDYLILKIEDADNDLVEQAKSFTENFPRGKSFIEQLDEANKLENEFTQLINDGFRDYNSEIKINNSYERIIYRLILQKSPKEVDNKVNKINSCISNKDGYTQKSSEKRIYLSSDKCSTTLDNRYDEIIFDLLKENLELKKEIEELKKQSNNSQVEEPIKDNEVKEIKISENNNCLKDKKEIALLELFGDFVTINYTNYDIDMGIDYKQAKKIIDESKQDSIPFNAFKGTDERAYRLINTDIRTVKDDCIVLIPSS
jgi:ParB/RepB/Spo0J family partition protein